MHERLGLTVIGPVGTIGFISRFKRRIRELLSGDPFSSSLLIGDGNHELSLSIARLHIADGA
jgi:hypothetical protein